MTLDNTLERLREQRRMESRITALTLILLGVTTIANSLAMILVALILSRR
jgi:hypothetical protein